MDIWTYLFDRCGSSRILILAAYRPEFLLPSGHLFANLKLALQAQHICREIRLPLLSCDNIACYINQVYPGHQFPPKFAQSIHLMTEGNALFMVDLLAHLRNLGIIVRDLERGFWSLNQSIPREEWGIPDSVNGLIDLRIRMLGEDDRHLLACAAVRGHDFDSAVVAKALETDQTEVEERLDALDRLHGLIGRVRPPRSASRRPTQQYRFAHVLYRNRLFKSLCPNRKAVLSGAIARALLEIYGDRSVRLASHVALLFEAAWDFVNAAKFFLAAGQQALDASATREAAMLARRGLSQIGAMQDIPERIQIEIHLQMLLAAALTQLKGYPDQEVRKSFDRAFELCERSEDKIALCLALQGLAGYCLTHLDLNMTLEISKRCSALAESSEDASLLLARSYLIHCVALSHLGQPVQAAELARRCIQICSSKDRLAVLKSGDFDMGIVAHGQLAWILWLCGYPDQARSSALEVLEAARELNHPYTSAFTLFLVSRVHGYLGDSRSSLEHTQEAISIAVHHGFSLVEGWARALQGWALACIGDPTGGIKEIERSLELLGAAGCRLSCTEFLGHKAMALLRIGEQAPALVAIDDAFNLVCDSGELYYEAELYHCRALILLNKRSAENRVQAESCLRRGISIARQQGLKGFELRCATTLARLQTEEAQVEDALCELFPIYSWFNEGFGTPDLREAKDLLDACPPGIRSAVRI